MTRSINSASSTGQDGILKLATFRYETRIQLQLKSGQSVRLAKDKQELFADPVAGAVSGGLEITSQMGIVELWWVGDLYIAADTNGAIVSYMLQGCSGNNATAVAA